MSNVIKIEGGHRLKGSVQISGAKNATVAIIPAAILAENSVVDIYGVPAISDVASLSILLKELDIEVTSPSSDHFQIDTSKMVNHPLDHEAATKLRASYYFMGALLGKYKYVKMQMPGGCDLGPRPFDLHLKGFEALGAKVEYHHGYYEISAERLIGSKVYLDGPSVGATINIMLAAVLAEGRTDIENAAKEPEIVDVATFLNKMGANIKGAGTSVITIEGVSALKGTAHEIIPDRIEAGTFIVMAAAVAEEVRIENIIPQHLEALISKLFEMGVDMDLGTDYVVVRSGNKLVATDIQTLPYPGFPTDLQQPLTALLTQSEGSSIVRETIYPERFKHCIELQRMGATALLAQGQATITGKTELFGAKVTATDLRCGASLVIAGLLAEGVTTIHDAYHIDRGYDNLDAKLLQLGAKVWRDE